MFGRNKQMSAPTITPFSYSHKLTDVGSFSSDWVADVFYAERAKELVVRTKEGREYLYDNVPRHEYNMLVDSVKNGWSVGSGMNSIKTTYGPSKHSGPFAITRLGDDVSSASVATPPAAQVDPDALPPVYETIIIYTLDGRDCEMRSTKNAEQALRDYLQAVDLMGLKAELQEMTLSFVKPEPF